MTERLGRQRRMVRCPRDECNRKRLSSFSWRDKEEPQGYLSRGEGITEQRLRTTVSQSLRSWGRGTCRLCQGLGQLKAKRKKEKCAGFSLLLAFNLPSEPLFNQTQEEPSVRGARINSQHWSAFPDTELGRGGKKQALGKHRD